MTSPPGPRPFSRAFIIRPFNKRKVSEQGPEVDFDKVETDLIRPALAALGVEGATTAEFVKSGDIRDDMFQRLLTAQLVIADISLHNANVWYELGIRHALRDKRTYLIRCKLEGHDMPFDIRTQRYLKYDHAQPAQHLDDLVQGLKATLESPKADSPLFKYLPDLQSQDPARFVIVPEAFEALMASAVELRSSGTLELLASEAAREDWGAAAIRQVGAAQISLKAWASAARVWEQIRDVNESDLEAHLTLGILYLRRAKYQQSQKSLEHARALNFTDQKSRIDALIGETTRQRWLAEWAAQPTDQQARAIEYQYLRESFASFRAAFDGDLHRVGYGIDALMMGTIIRELAQRPALAPVWSSTFPDDDAATEELKVVVATCQLLTPAIKLSLRAVPDDHDRLRWGAEFALLASIKPTAVAYQYKQAAASARSGEVELMLERLDALRRLAINVDAVEQAIAALTSLTTGRPAPPVPPQAAIVFLAAPDVGEPATAASVTVSRLAEMIDAIAGAYSPLVAL